MGGNPNNIVAAGHQMADPDLTSISGLAHADSNFIVSNGTDWIVETGATVRTSLGLGTAAVAATGIGNGNVPTCDATVADDDFLRINGTSIEGRNAGEVLSDIGFGSATVKSSGISLTPGTFTGTTDDGVLTYDHNVGSISWQKLANVCFLKGTKITLPDRSQINIEDLTLDDEVLTYNIDVISEIKNKNILCDIKYEKMNGRFSKSGIRNIWINPTDSYLVINNKLNITKEHIIHFKRDNIYYFKFAEYLQVDDELFTDKGEYETVESIDKVNEEINVYNFELDKDNTYFAENYLVHHYCKLCSGYANII